MPLPKSGFSRLPPSPRRLAVPGRSGRRRRTAGAHDPLGSPEQHRSSGQQGRAEIHRDSSRPRAAAKSRSGNIPANQLGSEMQQQSALRAGTQEMQSPATTSLVGIVKDYGLIDFPFIV